MKFRCRIFRTAFAIVLATAFSTLAPAQGVKRIVIVKIDGLPAYYVDRFVKQRDPETGRSVLPWIEEVFYRNGSRVPNFYTRGMSLSGPSWGQLDSGQHLQIKGNVEYDRFTLHSYDYLNFFPFYTQYGLTKRKADMPAVEVLDQLRIPIFCDAFDYDRRYTSQQLYQRGNNWEVIGGGVANLYPGSPGGLVDEWTLGFEFRKLTIDQAERDVLGKIVKRPEIDYLDYYDGGFDHVSHHNHDVESRLNVLKELDGLIGRMWVARRSSSRANETALVLVSDHGINSDENVSSQGFNLVRMLTSSLGGGHHVVTKRRLMLDYSVKGLNPFVTLIKTDSKDSYYLVGRTNDYPTALMDFDGNERSSIHLRNSDLNVLHILLQQLQSNKLSPAVRAAATGAFFDLIDRHRDQWNRTAKELAEEVNALQRWSDSQLKLVAAQPKKFLPAEIAKGADKEARRVAGLADIAVETEKDYRAYLTTLRNLLSLSRENFDPKRLRIEELIAPGAMGENNSVYQLQNYVAGLSREGLIVDSNKDLDLSRSFTRIDYLETLQSQRVRNVVQKGIGNRPIDFVGVRLPARQVAAALSETLDENEDPLLLYGGRDRQAILLTRTGDNGAVSYKYVPISGLTTMADGTLEFKVMPIDNDYPLRYFEDPNFAVPASERAAWFAKWHTELEWLNAVHRTKYSNAIIGLNEQLERHPVFGPEDNKGTEDDALIRRLRQRQRRLTEADLLILANDHWNFDVRGFNPGGNHGSFFRVSTNSTFMIAGGRDTGIPRGLEVAQPYDGLSFLPTLMRLMGKIDSDNRPIGDLEKRGFRRFPGRVVAEITGPAVDSGR